MQALPDVEQAVTHACVLTRRQPLVVMRVSWWAIWCPIGPAVGYHCIAGAVARNIAPHMVPVVLLQLPQLPLSANGSWIAKPYRCLN